MTVNILGIVLEMLSHNQHKAIMADRYSKRSCVIPTGKITSVLLAIILLHTSILLYGTLSQIVINEGTRLVSKFFTTFCLSLEDRKLLNSAYQPQTSVQVE